MKEEFYKQVLLKYEDGSQEYCWIPEKFATKEGRVLEIGKQQRATATIMEVYPEVRLKESQFNREWNNNI